MLETDKLPKKIARYLRAEHEFLLKIITPDSVVLDVGCGFGRDLLFVSKITTRVVAVEFSLPLIRKARGNVKDAVILFADARQIPLEDDSVDISMCMYNTLGNMEEPVKVIREMLRVTKNNGTVVISLYGKPFSIEERCVFYKSCGLTGLKVEGEVISTAEGFFSRVFCDDELEGLLLSAGIHNFVKHKISEIGVIIEIQPTRAPF